MVQQRVIVVHTHSSSHSGSHRDKHRSNNISHHSGSPAVEEAQTPSGPATARQRAHGRPRELRHPGTVGRNSLNRAQFPK